jgi:hypothetical protein
MTRTMKTMMVLATVVLGTTTVGCGSAATMSAGVRHGSEIAVVRQGAYSGEIAMVGDAIASHYAAEDAMVAHCHGRVRFVDADEAQHLAVRDPSDAAKADDVTVPSSAERVYYVCVTGEQRAER